MQLVPDVHVGARGTTDQGGAIETRNPSRARGINEPVSRLWAFCYFWIMLRVYLAHKEARLFFLSCLSHQCFILVHSHNLHIFYVIFYSQRCKSFFLFPSVFCTCTFTSSPHIMEDPSGAKGMESADIAKGPEVHVGARETTDQGGALETWNPSRARGIE